VGWRYGLGTPCRASGGKVDAVSTKQILFTPVEDIRRDAKGKLCSPLLDLGFLILGQAIIQYNVGVLKAQAQALFDNADAVQQMWGMYFAIPLPTNLLPREAASEVQMPTQGG
jgi:hypothetical protein